MKLIDVTTSGNTDKLNKFLKNMEANSLFDALDLFGQEGVAALESATPRDSGVAAGSWYYSVSNSTKGATISWFNSDKDTQGTAIVILIQYGHATGTGGYVPAIDFINPVMQKVFDDAINEVWKAVQS